MKNRKPLFLLLSANIVSGFAQGISMLAIPWYYTSIVDEASLFGAIYAGATFASLFWNLYAGTLIDRFPRKSIFIYVSLVCGAILLGVSGYGYYTDKVPLALVGLVFVTTMFNYNIHFGALYAFGQELSHPSQYGKISSYLEIQNQATSIFSGAFAAILLTGVEIGQKLNIIGLVIEMPFHFTKWDMQDIFLLDGITYFISIFLVSMIRYTPTSERIIDTSPIVERVKAGINFLRKNPALLSFGNYSYSIFVVLMVQVFMLLPIYVKSHLQKGSDVYASAEVFYSLGALLAGVFIRKIFHNRNTVYSIIVLLLITTIIFYLVAFTNSVGIFYFFSLLVGVTNAGARVLRTTYLFTHISNDIIGRTNSVFNVINILLRSLFLLLFSLAWFSEDSNITWAYFLCGTFTLLSAWLLIRNYKKL
ncbi:MAG TPA: MFS transporter [Bacteroidia bacterium]|nr:MFS transporter [Bacteroidia bacterium]